MIAKSKYCTITPMEKINLYSFYDIRKLFHPALLFLLQNKIFLVFWKLWVWLFLITWKLLVHISDRGRMQHIKPMGKGDPLCPLGFHPQVRWPTRCKRCFRYSILFVLNIRVYKLVHFITSNKIGVLRDDIVSKNTFLKTYIKMQGPERAFPQLRQPRNAYRNVYCT